MSRAGGTMCDNPGSRTRARDLIQRGGSVDMLRRIATELTRRADGQRENLIQDFRHVALRGGWRELADALGVRDAVGEEFALMVHIATQPVFISNEDEKWAGLWTWSEYRGGTLAFVVGDQAWKFLRQRGGHLSWAKANGPERQSTTKKST